MNRIRSNLHTHTVFSDGTDTAESYVQAAMEKGFHSLGFAEHAYNSYDTDCCIKHENVPLYIAEIARLKKKYADRITLYTGIENDGWEPVPRGDFDFVIGSVHYLKDAGGNYHNIDYLPIMLEQAAGAVAGGSMRGLVEAYFSVLADMIRTQRPDIIGHIDLITKLNADERYFDTASGWYHALLERAADVAAESGCIVEVNTGAMYRGYTQQPYPGPALLKLLHARRVPVTISSDAHCVDALDYRFDDMAELLRTVGYASTRQLVGGMFTDVAL